MHILIAGGTGFIGQALTDYYLDNGHQVSILGRSKDKIKTTFDSKVTAVTWDDLATKAEDILAGVHCLINLTGANIGTRKWGVERKKIIRRSRIETTDSLAKICAKLGKQAPVFFNASAVGVYGAKPSEQACTEATEINFDDAPDFLSEVGRAWEKATLPAENQGIRVIKLRLGVVLGDGGVLKKLEPFYQRGLGGVIGSGQQPFPWIAIQDVIRAIDFIYQHKSLSGPINLVAPAHDSQCDFAKALGKAMRRPTWLTTPAWLIQLLYGQMGQELLLQGQTASPERLQQENFTFECANLESALNPLYPPISSQEQKNEHEESDTEPPPAGL